MEVIVYTTPTCPYCRQVKEYLSRQAIPFREVDVARDPAAAAEMVRVSGQQGVPVTVIDGQAIVGFDRPRLDYILAQIHRPKLGAAVADAADMAAKGRCESASGAYVGKVTPSGAAERAGLKVGDVIVSLADQPIRTAADLQYLIGKLQIGRAVTVNYIRGDAQRSAILRL